MNVKIYVLKLEDGFIYVGRTHDLERRLEEHKNGYGARWTQLHKPVELLHVEDCIHEHYEDVIVKRYMKLYGILKVRGGSYSKPWMDDETQKFLKSEILHSENRCFSCGSTSHFASACDKKITIENRRRDVSVESYSERDRSVSVIPGYKKNDASASCLIIFIALILLVIVLMVLIYPSAKFQKTKVPGRTQGVRH